MATFRNQSEKLDYIDSLRGIAIILVIMVHVGGVLSNLSKGMDIFSTYGQFGVQLFFLVSAFTLCLTMNHRKEAHLWKKFFLRRYFRIAPLYYFGILLYFCFFSIRPLLYGETPEIASWYNFRNVLTNMLLMNDFQPGWANNNIVPGGWSIATEATFYVLFPLLFWVYKQIENYNWALLTLPIFSLIAGMFSIFFLEDRFMIIGDEDSWGALRNNSFLYFSILCQLPIFLMGMSLYYLLQKKVTCSKLDLYGSLLGFVVFSLFATFIMEYRDHHIYLFPFAAGIAFVFLFLLFHEIPGLSSPVLSKIGQLSYSIYLFHFLFAWEGTRLLYQQLHPYFSGDIILVFSSAITLGATTLLAKLSEKYIERPGVKLGKRLISKLRPDVAAPERNAQQEMQTV
jgi:peptidoglycan/LPS O-acetylase OafA/YrhL